MSQTETLPRAESRPFCEGCDHGVVAGQVCELCGGTGYEPSECAAEIVHTFDRGKVKFPPYTGPYPTALEGMTARFKHVISIAGYSDLAVESIFERWFEKYTAVDKVQGFVAMLRDYEQRYKEDGEII